MLTLFLHSLLPSAPSSGMFIKQNHDGVISTIEERVAKATHLHTGNQEDLQVLQ